jgi:putative DNA primase/helicase
MKRGGFERDSESPQPFMLKLRGKRYITASEVRKGASVDEGVVKELTGGDKITIRGLHSRPVNFAAEGVIVVRCNHRPRIDTEDPAVWDRIVEIPFNYRVPEKDQDFTLRDKLRAELPGILNWCLVGAARYCDNGRLIVPESVKRQTAAYKAAMDSINQFAKECLRKKAGARTDRADLYSAYASWCMHHSRPGADIDTKERADFYDSLEELGYKQNKKRVFKNVEIVD